MRKYIVSSICLVVVAIAAGSSLYAGSTGKEVTGKWDKAGKEISEAIDAVGDASAESWEKTKESTAD